MSIVKKIIQRGKNEFYNFMEFLFPGYLLHKWIAIHRNDGPETLVIEMSSFCNLRCKFCNFHGEENLIEKNKRGSFMTWNVVKELAKQTKRCSSQRINGTLI